MLASAIRSEARVDSASWPVISEAKASLPEHLHCLKGVLDWGPFERRRHWTSWTREALWTKKGSLSFTLQSYEKKLELTNYKQKTFEKLFVRASILLCIKQLQKTLWKYSEQRGFAAFSLPCWNPHFSCCWLQITDYSFFLAHHFLDEARKYHKNISKYFYYLYIIYIYYI